jgi:hypothetical protein
MEISLLVENVVQAHSPTESKHWCVPLATRAHTVHQGRAPVVTALQARGAITERANAHHALKAHTATQLGYCLRHQ